MPVEKNDIIINARELRNTLRKIVEGARSGHIYTVLYRSRPAFRIVPVDKKTACDDLDLNSDPLYRASSLGRSNNGGLADRHDEILYGIES